MFSTKTVNFVADKKFTSFIRCKSPGVKNLVTLSVRRDIKIYFLLRQFSFLFLITDFLLASTALTF